MNIKTRLEDDKVLFADFQSDGSRSSILMNLNKRGIYTVEDLINADMESLPATNRKKYNAMAHVFRNAYLGQDLVYDGLFQIEYKMDSYDDYKSYKSNGDIYSCALALRNLGLLQGAVGHNLIQLSRVIPVGTTFTIEDLLRDNKIEPTGPNLRRYYLQYIDNMKSKEKETTNLSESSIDSSVLSELKNQLSYLISMKEGLEQQIVSLQQQIVTLEGGSTNYGRK